MRVWLSGRLAQVLTQVGQHAAPVKCAFWSSGINCLATASWDKTVKFWQPGNPQVWPHYIAVVNGADRIDSFVNVSCNRTDSCAEICVLLLLLLVLSQAAATIQLQERAYCMDMRDEYMIVGCADRHVQVHSSIPPTHPHSTLLRSRSAFVMPAAVLHD